LLVRLVRTNARSASLPERVEFGALPSRTSAVPCGGAPYEWFHRWRTLVLTRIGISADFVQRFGSGCGCGCGCERGGVTDPLEAVRADAVGDADVQVSGQVGFQALPVFLVVSHLFAPGADREERGELDQFGDILEDEENERLLAMEKRGGGDPEVEVLGGIGSWFADADLGSLTNQA